MGGSASVVVFFQKGWKKVGQPPIPKRPLALSFPRLPELPDDDPLEALDVCAIYVQNVCRFLIDSHSYLSISVSALLVIVALAIRIWTDPLLPLAADATPLIIAVVGIIMSYRQPKERHHLVTTAVLVVVGIAGTFVMSWNRIRTEGQHRSEVEGLRLRIDSVGGQNTEILLALAPKPGGPISTEETELTRRQNVEKALRGQYILSHPNVSAGLLAGTELPPADWMNKRLKELGEKWSVSPTIESVVMQQESLPPPAVDVTVLFGNDEVSSGANTFDPNKQYTWPEWERICKKPFQCLPERDLKGNPVKLDVATKGWARIFFDVYNVGGSTLVHPHVVVNLARGKNVFLSTIDQRPPIGTPLSADKLEFPPKLNLDIVPFSKARLATEFSLDVTVGTLVDDFALGFQIFGENMSMHYVFVPVHVVRTGT
jgi:hypothetical protein